MGIPGIFNHHGVWVLFSSMGMSWSRGREWAAGIQGFPLCPHKGGGNAQSQGDMFFWADVYNQSTGRILSSHRYTCDSASKWMTVTTDTLEYLISRGTVIYIHLVELRQPSPKKSILEDRFRRLACSAWFDLEEKLD